MIQLSFQPALDPFHAVYRLFRLRPLLAAAGPLPIDHVRILDFYLLFPSRIEGIRLMPSHRRYRKLGAAFAHSKPYGNQPDDRLIFERMRAMQIAALETLSARSNLVAAQLKRELVEATTNSPPGEIAERIHAANESESQLFDFLSVLAVQYRLAGPNGLKDRTGLLEYRYDAL